jgi:hypothetical protein
VATSVGFWLEPAKTSPSSPVPLVRARPSGPELYSPVWRVNSANFRLTEFKEVRQEGCIRLRPMALSLSVERVMIPPVFGRARKGESHGRPLERCDRGWYPGT